MTDDRRSGNPAKKAAARKKAATVSEIGTKVHRIGAKKEVQYFDFQLPDSDEIHRVPLMQFLTVEQVNRLEEEDSIESVLQIFGEPETVEAVKSLDGEQLDELMTAWRDASALGMGES